MVKWGVQRKTLVGKRKQDYRVNLKEKDLLRVGKKSICVYFI